MKTYDYIRLKGSFSAVSKPICVSKYSYIVAFFEIHKICVLCTAPHSEFLHELTISRFDDFGGLLYFSSFSPLHFKRVARKKKKSYRPHFDRFRSMFVNIFCKHSATLWPYFWLIFVKFKISPNFESLGVEDDIFYHGCSLDLVFFTI